MANHQQNEIDPGFTLIGGILAIGVAIPALYWMGWLVIEGWSRIINWFL